MKYFIFFCLFGFLSFELQSQNKFGNEWITGAGGQRIRFVGSSIISNNNVIYNSYFTKGNSNICDSNGHLLLCSDGYSVYDSNAHYIDQGDTLIPIDFYIHEDGWSFYSQSSIFLPMDSNIYYFVTPTFSNVQFADCLANNYCFFDMLLYNLIDMNANGGVGKVVKRMQPIMENTSLSKSQMMACRHSNGKDWWLLKQGGDSNIVYKFLFTQDSVYDYGKQVFNAPVWGAWDIRGQSVFNKDGSKYATTTHGGSTGQVFLADFDRCYGILNNPKVIIMPVGSQHDPTDTTLNEHLSVGLAYSPNGKLLYVISMSNIWQYDLQDTTWYHVAGLDTSYQKFQDYDASYLGPDNKLYIGNFAGLSKQMSVIDNPDVKGAGCNFCPRCLRMDSLVAGYAGTPPCMPNYSLGAQDCWPLATNHMNEPMRELVVYPNPVTSVLNVEVQNKRSSAAKLELYNVLGEVVYSKNFRHRRSNIEIDMSGLPNGVYYLRCEGMSKKIVKE